MGLVRKIERNKMKQVYKDYNKGVEKKNRTSFASVWQYHQKEKKGGKINEL